MEKSENINITGLSHHCPESRQYTNKSSVTKLVSCIVRFKQAVYGSAWLSFLKKLSKLSKQNRLFRSPKKIWQRVRWNPGRFPSRHSVLDLPDGGRWGVWRVGHQNRFQNLLKRGRGFVEFGRWSILSKARRAQTIGRAVGVERKSCSVRSR